MWTRDIRQAVDDVLEQVQPDSGKLTLIAWSQGGMNLGRFLDPLNTAFGNEPASNISKVDRAMLLASVLLMAVSP